MKKKGTVRSKI